MLNTASLTLPKLSGIELSFTPAGLAIAGTIAAKEPDRQLGSFFRAVHDQAQAQKVPEVAVDVRLLTFVNSSAIRLFIDWAIWVSQPPGASYRLRFVRSPSVTWQRISFPPLAQLAGKHMVIEDGS